jgi:heat shock protein HslJ
MYITYAINPKGVWMKKLYSALITSLIICVSSLAGCAEGIASTVTQTTTSTFTTTTTSTFTNVVSTVTTTKLLYPVENITWVMEAYGDSSTHNLALENAEFTLYLDSGKGTFSGNVGINRYSGNYKLEGNQLSFPDHMIAVTQAYQGESIQRQQEEYLDIFMASDICEVIDGKLHITDGDRWIIYCRR